MMSLEEQKIAYVKYMLGIKHLRVNFTNTVTWASGIKSPIYVDNRGSLASFEIRNMIYQYMADYIKEQNIKCDAIVAAPTAGLHIGASVAEILGVPFVIMYKDGPKVIKQDPIIWSGSKYDLIIGTNPESIPWGIRFANELKLPFAYVRPPKKHGLKNSVEGFVKTNGEKKAMFLNYFVDVDADKDSYKLKAIDIMADLGVSAGETKEEWCHRYVDHMDLNGKNVVVLEDLFSTSGSAVENVKKVREYGAIVEQIMAIFDYELDLSNAIITEAQVKKSSFITAKQFLNIAEKQDSYIKEIRSKIDLFLQDPWEFTEKL
jgi:orotate phosphoribosyltransferase